MKNITDIVSNTTDSFKNNTMQIAVFSLLGNKTKYGINVNKVKSFVRKDDCLITYYNFQSVDKVLGVVIVRDETYPLISLDKWINEEDKVNKEDYNIVILTEFSKKKVAFLVKDILRIYNKSSEELEKSDISDNKISYITKIEVENKELEMEVRNLKAKLLELESKILRKRKYTEEKIRQFEVEEKEINNKISKIEKQIEDKTEELCVILDVETLLFEISGDTEVEEKIDLIEKKEYGKEILIAEDSKMAIKILERIMAKINVKYKIFTDGDKLINFLETKDEEYIKKIGLIITDIEMPVKDGFQVLKYVKSSKWKNVPVIVNSSMSNDGVAMKTEHLGADGFIEKTEPETINKLVDKYCS